MTLKVHYALCFKTHASFGAHHQGRHLGGGGGGGGGIYRPQGFMIPIFPCKSYLWLNVKQCYCCKNLHNVHQNELFRGKGRGGEEREQTNSGIDRANYTFCPTNWHFGKWQCKHAWTLSVACYRFNEWACGSEKTSIQSVLLSPSWVLHKRLTTKFWSPIGLYCINCMKFGQLILRKFIQTVATRCHILRLKCTKFDFGWGSAPDPAGGAYSAPPDPLAGFKGPYF